MNDDDPWGGLKAAVKTAVDVASLQAEEMFVTYSPDGEYISSDDVSACAEGRGEDR